MTKKEGDQVKKLGHLLFAILFAGSSGRKTGVVVWNISEDTPLEFKVSVPARKLVLAQSPEDTALSSTSDWHVLAPQSIALLVFE